MHLLCLLVITAAATLVDVIYCSIPVRKTRDWGGARSPMTAPSLPMHLAFETLNLRTWNGKRSSITKANTSTSMTASNLRSHPSDLIIVAQVSWWPHKNWPKRNLTRSILYFAASSPPHSACSIFATLLHSALQHLCGLLPSVGKLLQANTWASDGQINQVPNTDLLGVEKIWKWKKIRPHR